MAIAIYLVGYVQSIITVIMVGMTDVISSGLTIDYVGAVVIITAIAIDDIRCVRFW
jgi:serine acetyltransferase